MLRIAALVAGLLAGIVASLILALGGVEVTHASFGGLTDNQLAPARFIVLFLAELSLLGAGLSLALPRLGALLMLLSGIAWAGAAVALGHRFDVALLLPSGLSLIGALLSVLGFVFRRRTPESAHTDLEEEAEPPADPYDVSPPRTPREPLIPARQLLQPDPVLNERSVIPGRLNGGVEPPRRRAVEESPFREEEYEDEEPSGLARFGRFAASLLTFGLYATAAGATALLVVSYQRGDQAAVVTPPDAPSISSASSHGHLSSSEPPSSSQHASAPQLASIEPSSLEPIRVVGEPSSSSLAPPVAGIGPNTPSVGAIVTEMPASAPATEVAAAAPLGTLTFEPTQASSSLPPPAPSSAEPPPASSSSGPSSEPPAAVAEAAPPAEAVPFPATMPVTIAAERKRPPVVTAPRLPTSDM